jgi:hypothetical protein
MRLVRGVPPRAAKLILWDDGCQQIFGVAGSWELAAIELTKALESGKVRALDRVTYKDGKLEEYELLPDFWKANKISVWRKLRGEAAGERWLDFTNPLLLMGRERGAKHHVFFRRAGFDDLWPRASVAGAEPTTKPDRRKPGPRPRRDWPMLVAAELIRRALAGEKFPLDNDSKLARQLEEWLAAQFDWAPDNSEMRRLIAELLAPSRNSR